MDSSRANSWSTKIGNEEQLTVFAGLNVLENLELTYRVAEELKSLSERIGFNLVFKASFDKANRSSIRSFRGPGMEIGLEILREVSAGLDLLTITDVHEVSQVGRVSEVVDCLQLPAFLARQTDLVAEIAMTKKPVNVKKPQFMSPEQTVNLVNKFREMDGGRVFLCERGTCFGYDNLVVDMLGLDVMKKCNPETPIIFDVTHSLQRRDPGSADSGGRRQQLMPLALAGVATRIAGIFVEVHPCPDEALCDGPSALPLADAELFFRNLTELDRQVKSQTWPQIA